MTSLVRDPLGCFAPGLEMVSLQDHGISILRVSVAPWKGPAPRGCGQGFGWCSLLQWQ